MLSDRTELAKGGIGSRPGCELPVDELGKLSESREVTIVEPEFAEEFPDSLDGIEVRAVRREEEQDEAGLLKAAPFGVKSGMVIPGVIDDDDDAAALAPAPAPQLAKEGPAGLGIEVSLRLGSDQPSISDPYGAKVADEFAGRRMATNRVPDFRWNPHAAPAAVLLEMDFVQRPEINLWVAGESTEFFLLPPVAAGRLGRSPGAVCGAGNPIGERAVGTGAPLGSPRTASARKPTTMARPIAVPPARNRLETAEALSRPSPYPLGPVAWAGLFARPRSRRRIRAARNGAPSLPPFQENRLAACRT